MAIAPFYWRNQSSALLSRWPFTNKNPGTDSLKSVLRDTLPLSTLPTIGIFSALV